MYRRINIIIGKMNGGERMNSRERVLRAVNFQTPDRIPIDLGGIRASGINAVVYDKLKKRMEINSPTKIHDTMQILAEVEMDVLERLNVDVVPLDTGDAEWARMDVNRGIKSVFFAGWMFFFSRIRISQLRKMGAGLYATGMTKSLPACRRMASISILSGLQCLPGRLILRFFNPGIL